MDRLGWFILFVLTGFAFVMRFWRLGEVPPGFHYDEAFNGLDAYRLLRRPIWEWPIFFSGNYGREPLFIWLTAMTHALFGQSIVTVRSVSALCGALLTPAMAWLGWEAAPLLGVRNRRLFALWSGAAVLALLWSQIFARYGIRLSLFVLLETLLWAALWRAWKGGGEEAKRRRGAESAVEHDLLVVARSDRADDPRILAFSHPRIPTWWLVAGLFAGLSFYTYLPARLLPLVLLPLMAVALWRHRPRVIVHGRGIALGALVALIVAAPLGLYFVQNPVSFTTRIGQVSVVGREDQSLLANAYAVIGMFAWTGDHNPRSNLPFRPVLDPLLVPFFVVGLGLAVWRAPRAPGWLGQLWLLAGLLVMLLPTLLSEFAPNYQRAIGAIPFVVILVVLGLEGTMRLGQRRWRRGTGLYIAAGSLLLALSIGLTWRAYFVTWAQSPDLFPAWDVGFTRLARQIAETDREVRTYVTPRGRRHPTLAYLLQEADAPMPEGFDGRICMRVAMDGPTRYHFLAKEDTRSQALIESYFPDATLDPVVTETDGSVWANRLSQPADGAVVFPEMTPSAAELSDGIDLLGYWHWPEDGIRPGERFYARFFWQVRQTPSQNYTAFVQLLHQDENGNWMRIAGADRPPGEGTCPTTEWRPGEVVIDELQFMVPADLPRGDLYLATGFYTSEDGRRLAVANRADDQVLIGPIARQP